MINFLDLLLVKLEKLLDEYEEKMDHLDDYQGALMRHMKYGGIVSLKQYEAVRAPIADLVQEMKPYQYLYDELKAYQKSRLRGTPQDYLDIIRKRIIGKYAAEEKYEACAALHKFATEAEQDLLQSNLK